MEDTIKLYWSRNREFYLKEIPRESIISTFEGFVNGFPEDNLISKKISEILPNVDEFFINWDRTQDIQILFYVLNDDTSAKGIDIIYHHKVVLTTLNKYCEDGICLDNEDIENSKLLGGNK